MTKTEQRQGFWRELMQGFSVLQRLQWQAPWKAQRTC
jgi:hypothetical protein